MLAAMKRLLIPVLATLAALPLLAGSIDWPKVSFTVDKLKDANDLATKEKKAVAYIIMERGSSDDRKERRNKEDNSSASPVWKMTEDLAKDCSRFAVVVNVQPSDLQTNPPPFTEKVYNAMSGALGAGTMPGLVISDASGDKIFAYATSEEINDSASKVLRDAKRNIKEGKEAEYKKPKEEKDEKNQ
jgi:hypothetical protein